MRRTKPKLYYIIFALICQLMLALTGLISQPTFAGAQDFHFSDFTGDYYLTKDDNGISHLMVEEYVTVEFPDYNQNKGICRQIPFSNQGGVNITLPDLNRNNITVTRNGESEPIYSIERENDYYNVCTGTDDYVLGTQTYTFQYEFEKVVTDYGDFQELYWDTNGNGSSQRFDRVTARIHFDDENIYTGEKWCYVGKYGENGQERCTISDISDGVEFTAKNLSSHENLTFNIRLKPNSFTVPLPEENYLYIWLTVGLGIFCAAILILIIIKFTKTREKANHYKGFFVKPEYQPNKKYSLPEMAEIYIGNKKDVKVAMLLEMVVNHNIEFKKGERKKWSIIVKNLDKIDPEYEDLLSILNGGVTPKAGEEIELKARTATSKTISLKKSMEAGILSHLRKDKLVEDKYAIGHSGSRGISNIISSIIILIPMCLFVGIFILMTFGEWLGVDSIGCIMVFKEEFYIVATIMIAVTVILAVILSNNIQKYERHTLKGLEMSRYMDGLKLYIKMAEAERMKMLQSVKGADTSPEGIVKLYEKLLPYAAVFGLEESWMNEMKEYCKVQEIEEPDYLMQGIIAADMMRAVHSASNYATTASRMASSGGASSSGFSGGGGGGFSGGGGGGGGFGGR